MERKVLYLENLNCPSCAGQLEAAAKKMKGMKSARAAFGPGTLTVEFDPAEVTEESLHRLVSRFNARIGAVMKG